MRQSSQDSVVKLTDLPRSQNGGSVGSLLALTDSYDRVMLRLQYVPGDHGSPVLSET